MKARLCFPGMLDKTGPLALDRDCLYRITHLLRRVALPVKVKLITGPLPQGLPKDFTGTLPKTIESVTQSSFRDAVTVTTLTKHPLIGVNLHLWFCPWTNSGSGRNFEHDLRSLRHSRVPLAEMNSRDSRGFFDKSICIFIDFFSKRLRLFSAIHPYFAQERDNSRGRRRLPCGTPRDQTAEFTLDGLRC
jgi:hypothetical protein